MADKKKGAPHANEPKALKAKPSPIVKVNSKGGAYFKGVPYSLDMKARFHHQLDLLKEEADKKGKKGVTGRALAAKAMISVASALKIIHEDKSGTIGAPKKMRVRPGMGSKALSKEDEAFLISLQQQEPSTSLNGYKKLLFEQRGTNVSRSTLSRWFMVRKGKKVKRNKPEVSHCGYATKGEPSAP